MLTCSGSEHDHEPRRDGDSSATAADRGAQGHLSPTVSRNSTKRRARARCSEAESGLLAASFTGKREPCACATQVVKLLLLVDSARVAVRDAVTKIGPRRVRIAERDVSFGQAQLIDHVLRKAPHDFFQELEAGLGVAVAEQGGRSLDVQRPEQAIGRAEAQRGVELRAATSVTLDLGDQARSGEPRDLGEAPRDDRASEGVPGGHARAAARTRA